MVNLTLEACVRYPLYIIVYCKRVHFITDLLVWGSLRLAQSLQEKGKASDKEGNKFSCFLFPIHAGVHVHWLAKVELLDIT